VPLLRRIGKTGLNPARTHHCKRRQIPNYVTGEIWEGGGGD